MEGKTVRESEWRGECVRGRMSGSEWRVRVCERECEWE